MPSAYIWCRSVGELETWLGVAVIWLCVVLSNEIREDRNGL